MKPFPRRIHPEDLVESRCLDCGRACWFAAGATRREGRIILLEGDHERRGRLTPHDCPTPRSRPKTP